MRLLLSNLAWPLPVHQAVALNLLTNLPVNFVLAAKQCSAAEAPGTVALRYAQVSNAVKAWLLAAPAPGPACAGSEGVQACMMAHLWLPFFLGAVLPLCAQYVAQSRWRRQFLARRRGAARAPAGANVRASEPAPQPFWELAPLVAGHLVVYGGFVLWLLLELCTSLLVWGTCRPVAGG